MINEYCSFNFYTKKGFEHTYFQNARQNANFRTTVQMSYTMVLSTESNLDQYELDLSKMGPLLC